MGEAPVLAVQTAEEKATGGWHYLGDSEDVSVHKGFGAELPKNAAEEFPYRVQLLSPGGLN